MDSDWDKFAEALNEKIESKLEPLEKQLSIQQEMINSLRKTLSELVEKLTSKPANGKLIKLANIDKKIVNKKALNEDDRPGELTKESSEEHKEGMGSDDV